MAIANTMTKESIRAIIDSVEYDPMAGMGCYTKKDLLVDRLLAHCRTTQNVSALSAAPTAILSEVSQSEAKTNGNGDAKATKAA